MKIQHGDMPDFIISHQNRRTHGYPFIIIAQQGIVLYFFRFYIYQRLGMIVH